MRVLMVETKNMGYVIKIVKCVDGYNFKRTVINKTKEYEDSDWRKVYYTRLPALLNFIWKRFA